jgi:hypothetical protein
VTRQPCSGFRSSAARHWPSLNRGTIFAIFFRNIAARSCIVSSRSMRPAIRKPTGTAAYLVIRMVTCSACFTISRLRFIARRLRDSITTKEGESRTFYQPQETIDALAQLGFDTDDTKGNFSIDVAIEGPPDFNSIANFILRALHDGYGACGNMTLKFDAPFAPRTPSTCIPVR